MRGGCRFGLRAFLLIFGVMCKYRAVYRSQLLRAGGCIHVSRASRSARALPRTCRVRYRSSLDPMLSPVSIVTNSHPERYDAHQPHTHVPRDAATPFAQSMLPWFLVPGARRVTWDSLGRSIIINATPFKAYPAASQTVGLASPPA